jgi:hypothetical protein
MTVGTKTLLWGSHCAILHPWYVARAWIRLYGWPWHPAYWLAFVIHDWGYWGRANIDGPEGERHPLWAAKALNRLFGREWFYFCLLHSRFYSKRMGLPYSRLCVADKLAITLMPPKVWVRLARWSGEIDEYFALHADPASKYGDDGWDTSDAEAWFRQLQVYLRAWVAQHKHDAATDYLSSRRAA